MEMTKAERTKIFIIEKVAPVFNKRGYIGTSLSDITKATGLTKGAVYGNFGNKEQLAIEAFKHNITKAIGSVSELIKTEETTAAKFKALTNYYRGYYQNIHEFGGCPVLNVGVDSDHTNPLLKAQVGAVLSKLQYNIVSIFKYGAKRQEIKPNVDAQKWALRIISIIEGAVYTSTMLDNETHLGDMMDMVDRMIGEEVLV